MKFENALVLLYGIPASGKTTLSHNLCSHIKNNKEYLFNGEVFILEADLIEKQISISNKIENIKSDAFLIENQEKAQQICYQKISELLSLKNPQNQIIIFDDNNLKKGIRKKYFKLARKNFASFVEIYVKIELEKALENSAKRLYKIIDEEIIKKDFYSIEHDSKEYSLEINSKDNSELKTFNIILNKLNNNFEEIKLFHVNKPILTEKSLLSEVDEFLKSLNKIFIGENKEKMENEGKAFISRISETKKTYFINFKRELNDIKSADFDDIKIEYTKKLKDLL